MNMSYKTKIIYETIRKLLEDKFWIEKNILMKTHLIDNLNFDDIEKYEFFLILEEIFDINFTDDEITNNNVIKNIIILIKLKEQKK